jgi:hypothetical protein
MKVKSEHHKVSGSSSAKAHRVRAANLPSHRLSEIQRSEVTGVVRSAGGKLSPIGYSCHRKPASINETIILFWKAVVSSLLQSFHYTPPGEKARFGPKAAAGPVSNSDVEGTCQTLAVKMRTLKRRWRRARADSSCASLPSFAAVGSLWHISVRRSLVSLSRIGASGRQPPRLSAILLQFTESMILSEARTNRQVALQY